MSLAKKVRIFGDEFEVKADVQVLSSYSAHGDYEEILKWLAGFQSPPEKTFLVHGEPHAMQAMKQHIEEKYTAWQVAMPAYRESFNL